MSVVPFGVTRSFFVASLSTAREPLKPVSTFGVIVALRSADDRVISIVGYGGCSSSRKPQHFVTFISSRPSHCFLDLDCQDLLGHAQVCDDDLIILFLLREDSFAQPIEINIMVYDRESF